ncbi:DNA adenine methylase [Limnospira platensis]|uniref:DNA adenine methylase n=1 Tax=Limnospira platensis TaxID=118562 RepID=UPI003D6E72D6
MRPLISYYGGKQRIASKILPHFPPHKVYVEPFAGGATMLFLKPLPTVTNHGDYRECLNDTSDLLINMYRVAKKYPDKFTTEINATLYSQSDHRKAIAICKHPDGYSDIEKAWAYYINIQQGFAKELNTGWGTSRLGQNNATTFANRNDRLSERLARLRNVFISCEDAIQCIERWDSPDTLFYCDPPYPNTRQGHYGGYTIDDWKRLCNALDNINGSYVVSNYYQPVEPTSATNKIEIKATMSARINTTNNKRTEVLWICDRSTGLGRQANRIQRKKSTLSEWVQLSLAI